MKLEDSATTDPSGQPGTAQSKMADAVEKSSENDVKSCKNGANGGGHENENETKTNGNGATAEAESNDVEMAESPDSKCESPEGKSETADSNGASAEAVENGSVEEKMDTSEAKEETKTESSEDNEKSEETKDETPKIESSKEAEESSSKKRATSKSSDEECSSITMKPKDSTKELIVSSDSPSSSKSGKSDKSDDVEIVSSGGSTKKNDDDLEKLKSDKELKLQTEDGETFEVQMISSSEGEDDDDDDDDESASNESSSRAPSVASSAAIGSVSDPVMISEKKPSVATSSGGKMTVNNLTATVTKMTIPASAVSMRPGSFKPSILSHPGNQIRQTQLVQKGVSVVKSNSVSNIQPSYVLQQPIVQVPPPKPLGPTNEELAIEFNKKSRKKLTINNLIDALKEFGLDLDYLREEDGKKKDSDTKEKESEKKEDTDKKKEKESDKKEDHKKESSEKKSEEKSEKDEKSDEKKEREKKDSEKKDDAEVKSDSDDKEVAKEKVSEKSEEKKSEKSKEKESDEKEDEGEAKEKKVDEDKSEAPSTPSRRSSRLTSKSSDKDSPRSSKSKEKKKETEEEPESESEKKDAKKDDEGEEKDAEKKKDGEEKKEEESKKEEQKKSDKKEEVIIDSDDEKENKKKKEEENDQEADLASHGDVAKKLRPVAKFLYFTGLDFSREVVYADLVIAGDKKHKAKKLYGPEIHDLQQMKRLYHTLHYRNKPLRPRQKKGCKRCPFATESKSVLYYHQQQGHFDERQVKWSCALCDFDTRTVQAFCFHVESEHGMTGLPMAKSQFFSCNLCSYNSSTKSHLTKHMMKCEKLFQPEKHQFPLYDDINFIFRALPGPLIKVPQPPPQQRMAQPQLRPNVRPAIIGGQQRLVLPPGAVPILPRGTQYRFQPMPQIRPAPMMPVRTRYPPQTAQQFISNTIQQMKLVPASSTQPIVIGDSTPTTATIRPAQQPVRKPGPAFTHAAAGNIAPKPKTGKYSYEVCEICGGFVLDRAALRLHFAMAHNINLREDALDTTRSPPLSCDYCTSRFFTFQGLSLHKARSNHARADQALCHICNTLTSDMPSHIKTAHNIVPNQLNTIRICPVCGQCVLSEKTEAHIERVHNIKLDKPSSLSMSAKPVYGCNQCTAQFTERSLLNLHIRKGHPAPSHKKCPICGALTQTSGYNRHVLVAHCKKKLRIKLTRCDENDNSEPAPKKPRVVIDLDTPRKVEDDGTVVELDTPEKTPEKESPEKEEMETETETKETSEDKHDDEAKEEAEADK